MSESNKTLYNLDELSDYKVADEYSDVRDWQVMDSAGRSIGKVDHLLVNKATERVVYLDVEVDQNLIDESYKTYQESAGKGIHGFLNEDGENHLIIPIGMARLDEENKLVYADSIDYPTFSKVKRYRKGNDIDFDYELNTLRHYRGDPALHSSNDAEGFYQRDEFQKGV